MLVLFPLLLVLSSAALSFIYKSLCSLQISVSHFSKLTAAHAFAIELIQLALLLMDLILSWNMLRLSPTVLYMYHILDFELYISTWLAASGTLAIYTLAIVAIELIDNLVQIGTWRHPVQVQTFLLTRSAFLPCTVTKRRSSVTIDVERAMTEKARGRSRTRKMVVASKLQAQRARSEPTTPVRLHDVGVQFPSERRNALVQRNSTRGVYGSSRSIRSRTISTPSIVRGVGRQLRDGSPFATPGLRAFMPMPFMEQDVVSSPGTLASTISSSFSAPDFADLIDTILALCAKKSQAGNITPKTPHNTSTKVSSSSTPMTPESLSPELVGQRPSVSARSPLSFALKLPPRSRLAVHPQTDRAELGERATDTAAVRWEVRVAQVASKSLDFSSRPRAEHARFLPKAPTTRHELVSSVAVSAVDFTSLA